MKFLLLFDQYLRNWRMLMLNAITILELAVTYGWRVLVAHYIFNKNLTRLHSLHAKKCAFPENSDDMTVRVINQ